jgi:hypothetical protein
MSLCCPILAGRNVHDYYLLAPLRALMRRRESLKEGHSYESINSSSIQRG